MNTLDELFFKEWKAHHSLGYGEGWQIPEGKFQKATSVTEPGREFSKEKRVDGLFQTWILTPFLPLARSFVIQFKMCGSVT